MIHDWLTHPITRGDALEALGWYLVMQALLLWRDHRRARRRPPLTVATSAPFGADAMRDALERMARERKVEFRFPTQ